MSFYLKQIVSKLTPSAKECLDMAINLAISRRHYEVDILHLVYVIINYDKKLIDQLTVEALLQPTFVINAIEKEFEELQQENTNDPVFSEILVSFLKSLGYMPVLNGLVHPWIYQPYLLLLCIQKENYLQSVFSIV